MDLRPFRAKRVTRLNPDMPPDTVIKPRTLRLTSLINIIFFVMVGHRSAFPDDWPHWRGPNRNGISQETSGYQDGRWKLRESWSGAFGDGASSPIIAEGKLFTMGWRANQEHVFAADAATGASVWTASYPAPRYGRFATGDQDFYAGPSSTPEFDSTTGFLYTLGIDGDLNCWDSRSKGRKVWHLNLYQRFGVGLRPQATTRPGSQRDYGYTTAPYLHREWVIIEVGDEEGNLMAFDKRTGERAWVSENKDPAGHAGGMAPMVVEGIPCVAVLTLKGLHVARLDQGNEGKTVATYPWTTDFANGIASPAVHQNFVVISSGYNRSSMVKLRVTMKGAERVWQVRSFSPVCTPVIHQGSIYWSARGLWRLDFETGEVKWNGGRFGDAAGSCVVTADDRILVWANEGDLALAETASRARDDYKELAWNGGILKAEAWPAVVLSGGRIYCKDRAGNLKCLAVNPKPSAD